MDFYVICWENVVWKKQVNKYKFYNPIWQNNSYIKALQEYLGYVHAYSFIVFGDNCELKDGSYNARIG